MGHGLSSHLLKGILVAFKLKKKKNGILQILSLMSWPEKGHEKHHSFCPTDLGLKNPDSGAVPASLRAAGPVMLGHLGVAGLKGDVCDVCEKYTSDFKDVS